VSVGACHQVALANLLEPGALDIGLGRCNGALCLGDLGVLLGLARLQVFYCCFCHRDIGLGLVDAGLVVVVLDLDQKLICLDALEILNGHLAEIAVDLGAERREVAFDVGVVRGLRDVRTDPGVPARREQDCNRRSDHQNASSD
jgi:hypothetical protein